MSSLADESAPDNDSDDTVFPALKQILRAYYCYRPGEDPAEREQTLLRRYAAEGDTGEFEGLLDEIRVAIRTPAAAAALVRETTGADLTAEDTKVELEALRARLADPHPLTTDEDTNTTDIEANSLPEPDTREAISYIAGQPVRLPGNLLPGRTAPLWVLAAGSAVVLAISTYTPLHSAISVPLLAISLTVLGICAVSMHGRYRDVMANREGPSFINLILRGGTASKEQSEEEDVPDAATGSGNPQQAKSGRMRRFGSLFRFPSD